MASRSAGASQTISNSELFFLSSVPARSLSVYLSFADSLALLQKLYVFHIRMISQRFENCESR